MDDKQLTTLLTMAREAEALEHELAREGEDAQAGREVPSSGRRRSRVRTRAVGGVAMLVVFLAAIGAVVLARSLAGKPGMSDPTRQARSGLVDPKSLTQHMLIALYRADDDKASPGATCPECWCVKRWKPELKNGKDLASVGGDELIGASIERSCVGDPARMVVIGLSGPADALPKSDDQARDVAMCILDKTGDGAVQPVGCLASSVDVRVETWKR